MKALHNATIIMKIALRFSGWFCPRKMFDNFVIYSSDTYSVLQSVSRCCELSQQIGKQILSWKYITQKFSAMLFLCCQRLSHGFLGKHSQPIPCSCGQSSKAPLRADTQRGALLVCYDKLLRKREWRFINGTLFACGAYSVSQQ